MKRLADHDFLVRLLWQGRRKWVFWMAVLLALSGLGVLRKETGAEYAFANLALFPVAAMAWIGGRRPGFVLAALAATMWCIAEVMSEREFSSAWIPLANAAVHAISYIGVVWLVSQIAVHLQREHLLATRDSLTGLVNRRHFLERGAAEAVHAKRYGNAMSVLFLDLDNFKALNDSAGHHAGDSALAAVAEALVAVTRESDLVSRLGGDEFAVVLPVVDYEAAQKAARKIRVAVERSLLPFKGVSASMGLVWFQQPVFPFERMLNLADAQMYLAKEAGKGRTQACRHGDV